MIVCICKAVREGIEEGTARAITALGDCRSGRLHPCFLATPPATLREETRAETPVAPHWAPLIIRPQTNLTRSDVSLFNNITTFALRSFNTFSIRNAKPIFGRKRCLCLAYYTFSRRRDTERNTASFFLTIITVL